MKNLIISFCLLFSVNVYALDMTSGNTVDENFKEDKQESDKRNRNLSSSEEKSKTRTTSDEISNANSTDLKLIGHHDALIVLMALEKANIEPFKSCEILTKPRLLDDFGLGCKSWNGMINSNRCSALEEAGKANLTVENLIDTTLVDNPIDFREFTACVGLYGALIAQSLKEGTFDVQLKDEELKDQYLSLNDSIEFDECRLDGSVSNITCGETTIKIGANPSLTYGSIPLYSDSVYYGYSLSINDNKSKKNSETFSKSKSKKRSEANSLAKTITNNKTLGISTAKNSGVNIGLSKFLPNK